MVMIYLFYRLLLKVARYIFFFPPIKYFISLAEWMFFSTTILKFETKPANFTVNCGAILPCNIGMSMEIITIKETSHLNGEYFNETNIETQWCISTQQFYWIFIIWLKIFSKAQSLKNELYQFFKLYKILNIIL